MKTSELTKEESKFLLDAINVAYDTACVYEIHEELHDREVMESAMAKLREAK